MSSAHLNNILVKPKARLLSFGDYFKFPLFLQEAASFSLMENATAAKAHNPVKCYVNGHKKIYYPFWITLVHNTGTILSGKRG